MYVFVVMFRKAIVVSYMMKHNCVSKLG